MSSGIEVCSSACAMSIQETRGGLPRACAIRPFGSIGLHKRNPISNVRLPNNKKLCHMKLDIKKVIDLHN